MVPKSAADVSLDVVKQAEGSELSIGEFARWSRLPVSTLRYYHEIGVLLPARVDASSGYRYYESDQLETAVLISDLRRLGMPPAEIATVTGGGDFSAALKAHRRRLVSEMEDRERAIARLDELLAASRQRTRRRVAIETRLPAVVASQRGQVSAHSAAHDVRRLIVRLRAQLRTAGATSPEWYGAMFPLDLESDPVEVAVYADAHPPWPHSIPTEELPGGDFALASHERTAPFASAYADLLEWCETNHRRPAGIVLEEYRARKTTVAISLEEAQ